MIKAPSPALVISCIALFVALGGTAIAATPIAKQSTVREQRGQAPREDGSAGRGPAGTCV